MNANALFPIMETKRVIGATSEITGSKIGDLVIATSNFQQKRSCSRRFLLGSLQGPRRQGGIGFFGFVSYTPDGKGT